MSVTPDRNQKLPKNLILRGKPGSEIIYYKRVHKARQILKSLHLPYAPANISKAVHMRDAYNARLNFGLPLIEEDIIPEKLKPLATLGDVFKVYREAAGRRRLTAQMKPRTAHSYISMLKLIIRDTGEGLSPDNLTVKTLNRDLIKKYETAKLAELGDNSTAIARRRMAGSIRSTLRQARALFSAWAMEEYEEAGLRLPDLTGFLKKSTGHIKKVRYKKPDQELIDSTLSQAMHLQYKEPEAFMVFVLGYHVGLRPGEMACARRGWLQQRGDVYQVEINEDKDECIKSKEGRIIPVPEWVYTTLSRGCRDYLIVGKTKNARENFIKREFAAWMRLIGWDKETYPKAAHELRKLFGCRVVQKFGPLVAQRRLGHASFKTTEDYYSDYIDECPALPL